jgi:DNA-binding response OmpR family regulator
MVNPMICRAIVIDRSLLAVNMYRLLLKPLVSAFLVAKRYEEARPWFFRREKINMAIVNSNTFGKKFEEYYRRFTEDEPLKDIPKIFLCRDKENDWQKKLKGLPNTNILMRPFHPDELLEIVRRVMEQSK